MGYIDQQHSFDWRITYSRDTPEYEYIILQCTNCFHYVTNIFFCQLLHFWLYLAMCIGWGNTVAYILCTATQIVKLFCLLLTTHSRGQCK